MKLSESTIDGKSYTKADENLLNALDTGVYLYIKGNGEGAIHLFDEDYSIHFYPLFEKAIIDGSDESSYIINFTYENKKLMLISANTDTQFVLYKSNKSAPYSLTSLANETSKSLPVKFIFIIHFIKKYYPMVAKTLSWLLKYAPSRMTGTGASCFASFDDEKAAIEAFNNMPNEMRGFVAKAVNISPLKVFAESINRSNQKF